MRLPSLLLVAAIACTSGCANAQIRIADRERLVAALTAAKGGETIELEPGFYGGLSFTSRQFPRPITIQSRDPAQPARFDSIWISKSKNITVRNVDVGRGLRPGEPEYTQLSSVGDSENVRLEHVAFHGSLDGNPSNDGWGLYVVRVKGLTVEAGSFEEFHRAYVIEVSSDITIANNRFTRIRSDGGDFTAVDNVIVRGNRYSDFMPKEGDHPDAIQFWTNGQVRPSTNILIENNVIMQGAGTGPQGIFIADEVGHLPYRNLIVRNNLVYTDDEWEAILVAGAADAEITNNTVLSSRNGGKGAWIRIEKNGRVVVRNNVMVRFVPGNNEQVSAEGNLVLQDSWGKAKRMRNFAAGRNGQPEDFVLPGVGFQLQTP